MTNQEQQIQKQIMDLEFQLQNQFTPDIGVLNPIMSELQQQKAALQAGCTHSETNEIDGVKFCGICHALLN